MPGCPRTPAELHTKTMRPCTRLRMAGSRALVSSTGPITWVANMRCHSRMSVSSTMPAAEMPALWTSAYGAPTRSSIALAAAADRRGIHQVELHADQPVVVLGRAGGLAQQWHAVVRAYASPQPRANPRRWSRTAEAKSEPAGRTGDDDCLAALRVTSPFSGAQAPSPGGGG